MRSIQSKFIVLILTCVGLSAGVIGGAGIFHAQHAVDNDSREIMNLICAQKAQEINGQLGRIEQSVHTLAAYAIGQLESLERLKTDKKYLEEYTKLLEAVAVNAANNTEGALAVYVRFNPDFTPPTSGLFWSKTNLDGSFRQLPPTDFCSFKPDDMEHVGWYYLPIKNGKPTWMAPYLNKNIDIKMISFVIPLYVNYQTVGVVGMDIDFGILTDMVERITVYQSGYAFLTDNAAKLIFHPDATLNSSTLLNDSSTRNVLLELRGESSARTLIQYTWQSCNKKMAFRELNNGMKLILTAPVSEIDATKNKLILQILIALGVIVLVCILLTLYMTRRLINPLRNLSEAAQKIAAGDLSTEIIQQKNNKDEIGMLADSFKQTVDNMQKDIQYINDLAYRDPLTGVKNTTAYQDAGARIEKEMRSGKPEFALLLLDINDLKRINDTFGHDFGDRLIINACRIICNVFQHSPVYRIGGDEFVVILENKDYETCSILLKKLEEEIAHFNKNCSSEDHISIARGIAIYNAETDLVLANVFKRADEAMYQNKASMKKNEQNRGEKENTDQ